MNDTEIVENRVKALLEKDKSGHGFEHVKRVARIATEIAKQENANTEIVEIIALLHDVDDYKLFGEENAKNLTNTKNILSGTKLSCDQQALIIEAMHTIGYSKRLKGITPTSIEAKIVSDADMIDGMGAVGILRTFQYNISHDKEFFNREIFPCLNMDSETYKSKMDGTSVTHIFEKILTLKNLMLTEAGRIESQRRHDFIKNFLREYFMEVDAPEWIEYLENYKD